MEKKKTYKRRGILTSVLVSHDYGDDDKYRRFLKNKDISYESILSNVHNLLISLDKNNKVLVMGDVQSGKTLFLMILIAKLFDLKKVDVVIMFVDSTNLIKKQNRDRFHKDFSKLSEVPVVETTGSWLREKQINENDKVVYVVIKHSDIYDNLSEFKKIYKNKRILVIQDEGDDFNLGAVYNKLLKDFVRSSNNWIKVLYLTATPFRNLIEDKDIEDFLYLKSSPYYEGINSDWNYSSEEFDKMLIKKNDIEETTKKLIDCFRFFYCKWLLHVEKNNLEQSVFVINIDKQIKIQKRFKNAIKGIYNPVSFIEAMEQIYNSRNFTEDQRTEYTIELQNRIEHLIRKHNYGKNRTDIRVINSDIDEKNRVIKDKYTVLIGGNLLSRGYTIKNLHMMFLFNTRKEEVTNDKEKLKSYGTLLQKARWLGYYDGKERKKELVHIYMLKDDIKKFEDLKQIVWWTRHYTLEKGNYLEYLKMNTRGIFNE